MDRRYSFIAISTSFESRGLTVTVALQFPPSGQFACSAPSLVAETRRRGLAVARATGRCIFSSSAGTSPTFRNAARPVGPRPVRLASRFARASLDGPVDDPDPLWLAGFVFGFHRPRRSEKIGSTRDLGPPGAKVNRPLRGSWYGLNLRSGASRLTSRRPVRR